MPRSVKTYVTSYRSPGLPYGALRKLGTAHMHIDGGGKGALVLDLVKQMESTGVLGKLTTVSRSVAGPQRLEHPLTYASHTPGTLTEEELEYFSTTSIDTRDHAIQMLRQVLPSLNSHPGSVVEVERVVATVEDSKWKQVSLTEMEPVETREVGYRKSPTLPFECHHAIDVSPQAKPSLLLDQLLNETASLGVVVGGWFTFEKDTELSYRSNSFWPIQGLRERILMEHSALQEYLQSKGLRFRLWTIVEQVIGIWRAPLTISFE